MSEDLRRRLRLLEEDYMSMPPVAQLADLQEINQIRSQLGMPLVDARLKPIATAAVEKDVKKETIPKQEKLQDHTEARELYQAYLKRMEELEVHRAYAERVVRATDGHGQTPVRPLATMGTNGGPLLCDYCGRPIVLEGGRFHGVAADAAWNKDPSNNWTSWILGGMVVEIETNGTLRIYHGYPGGRDEDCCNIASREAERARAGFGPGKRSDKWRMVSAFIEQEFPDMTLDEQTDLLNNILDTMYEYDPGIGINRPGKDS